MTAAVRRKNLVHRLSRNWKKIKQIFDETSKLRKRGPAAVASLSNQTLHVLEKYLDTLEAKTITEMEKVDA